MDAFGSLFNRHWWWTTLLVLAAIGVMARLGIWQLDRLDQRRAFNTRVTAQMNAVPLTLTGDALSADLINMEYRSVSVRGQYDFSQQVALRNQAWDDKAGVALFTPLMIEGSKQAILVERGWIPLDDTARENWSKYDEPGTVEVRGLVRASQDRADFGNLTDPEGALSVWNLANVSRIRSQISHPLLPVYIQQAPDPTWTSLPHRLEPELDLTEGPHFGYAMQWFLFAGVLGLGYPFYVRDQTKSKK